MSKNLRLSEAEYRAILKRQVERVLAGDVTVFKAVSAVEREESDLELMMAAQIKAAGLPEPRRQFHPIDGRNFMCDFCWPNQRVIVECDGSVHRIKGRFKADQERRNLLTLAGWLVLSVNREHIKEGLAVEWLRELLAHPIKVWMP